MKSLLPLLTIILGIGNMWGSPTPAWTGNPMRPGIAALTCTSSGDQTALGQTEHVLAWLDVRDAIGCGAVPIVNPPTEWTLGPARMYWPAVSPNNDWTIKTMGEVFGVDVGTGNLSNVYVSAAGPKPCNWGGSNIWNNRPYNTAASNTGNGGEVWRVHATTHAPFLLAQLPNHKGYFQGTLLGPNTYSCVNGNSFVGLGQVSVNTKPGINKVYVSNMDDGKIYTLTDGVFNSSYPCAPFDHGATKPGTPLLDDPTSLYTQRSRLIFGLEYHPQFNRLFYALRNGADQDEVWSIGLDAVGCPTGTQCLEFVSPSWTSTPMANSLPSDIQFSDDGCRMLISQISIRYEFVNATAITPAFGGPVSQLIPMHYAHTSGGYEAKINSNPACNPSFTRWTYINRYDIGGSNYGPFCNAVAGDYGYGTILGTQAIDSVVFVADVIRQYNFGSYKFGLEIHPLGDYNRTIGLANFDVPLLSGNPNVQSTKIQLNDIDILHKDACAKIITSNVTCPVGAGGQHKVTINITNTSSIPYWGLNLTNCAGMPMMPGATPISPVLQAPSPINLGNPLLPGASTGPLVVCLPGIPPAGGMYCFCVNLMGEVEGEVFCKQMICVNAPICTPPCATIVGQQVVCDQGNYLFSLCVTNLSPTPVTTIKFTPCTDPLGGPLGPVPTPNPYTLPSPLPNGGTAYFPFALPAPNTTGGTYCFNVILCGDPKPGDPHPVIVCQEKICLELPPCLPPCMELTPKNIKCPTVNGGAYTLDLTIKNLSALPAHFVTLSQCTNPPAGCTPISPPPGAIPLGSPLLPGNSTTISVSLPGLPCTGFKACFCVTLFNQEPPNPATGEPSPLIFICKEPVCVQLPACPCPPCMTLNPGTVVCPTVAGAPYTYTFTITNLQPVPAYCYTVTQCPVPAGYNQVQPTPVGTYTIPGGPLAQNATSAPITVSLPVPLTGGNYCFCVRMLAENQQTLLCQDKLCFTLPSCRCAEIITPPDVVCLPSGASQVNFTVTNFTNLYASPYTFNYANFSPATGFSPSQLTLSPPITPGNSGPLSVTYNGPPGNTCVSLILSDVTRTKCCTIKLCFNNPSCTSFPPDLCDMAPEFICEKGVANLTIYICNNSPNPKSYLWNIAPVAVPGCTNLPAGAFTPASGTTVTIGANTCLGINCTVNTASLTPGQCAGFQFCFVPKNTPTAIPFCCTSKIVCPRTGDPCIGIGNPHAVMTPGKVIGIPIIIKNPTSVILETELVPTDRDGLLTFSRSSAGGLADDSDGDILTDDTPLSISLLPGEVYETTLYATYSANVTKVGTGTIIIAKPCVGRVIDDHYWGTATVHFGPTVTASSVPTRDAIGQPTLAFLGTRPAARIPFKAQPGVFYHLVASPNLAFSSTEAYLLTPASSGLIIEPDGAFTSLYGDTAFDIPLLPFLPKEFYQFSTKPITAAFNPALNADR